MTRERALYYRPDPARREPWSQRRGTHVINPQLLRSYKKFWLSSHHLLSGLSAPDVILNPVIDPSQNQPPAVDFGFTPPSQRLLCADFEPCDRPEPHGLSRGTHNQPPAINYGFTPPSQRPILNPVYSYTVSLQSKHTRAPMRNALHPLSLSLMVSHLHLHTMIRLIPTMCTALSTEHRRFYVPIAFPITRHA